MISVSSEGSKNSITCRVRPMKLGIPEGNETPAPQRNTTRPASARSKRMSGMAGPSEWNLMAPQYRRQLWLPNVQMHIRCRKLPVSCRPLLVEYRPDGNAPQSRPLKSGSTLPEGRRLARNIANESLRIHLDAWPFSIVRSNPTHGLRGLFRGLRFLEVRLPSHDVLDRSRFRIAPNASGERVQYVLHLQLAHSRP